MEKVKKIRKGRHQVKKPELSEGFFSQLRNDI